MGRSAPRVEADQPLAHGGFATDDALTSSLQQMVVRVSEMAEVLELVCDCARQGEPAIGTRVSAHRWPCPAGAIEFWCSRYPDRVQDWIESIRSGAVPLEPGW